MFLNDNTDNCKLKQFIYDKVAMIYKTVYLTYPFASTSGCESTTKDIQMVNILIFTKVYLLVYSN